MLGELAQAGASAEIDGGEVDDGHGEADHGAQPGVAKRPLDSQSCF